VIPVDPLDFPADLAEDEADEETYAVRPYAVTGGRTRTTTNEPLPVEALVQALGAHVSLPVGIVRVIVSDLSDAGKVRIHGSGALTASAPATSLSVLESVLNGISSL
jgi:hypothetical protein